MHKGIDLRAKTGTEVRVAARGTVHKIGYDKAGYGHYVIVNHGDGYYTRYAHLSKNLFKVGDPVGNGQIIALSGNSGGSTSPHLHFELLDTENDSKDLSDSDIDPTSIEDLDEHLHPVPPLPPIIKLNVTDESSKKNQNGSRPIFQDQSSIDSWWMNTLFSLPPSSMPLPNSKNQIQMILRVLPLLLILLIIDSCTLKREQKSTHQSSSAIESFETFYSKFYQDTAFQFSRIAFPLPGSYSDGDESSDSTFVWDKESWQLFSTPELTDGMVHEFDRSDSLVIEKIYLPESGFGLSCHFQIDPQSRLWYLVYYTETNL